MCDVFSMKPVEQFGELIETTTYPGKIGFVLKFTIVVGKEAEFVKNFTPCVNDTNLEKGCIKD